MSKKADDLSMIMELNEQLAAAYRENAELHRRIAVLAQSNAGPQTLRDAAENLLIAIGMGWDLNGCAENLRAALAADRSGK